MYEQKCINSPRSKEADKALTLRSSKPCCSTWRREDYFPLAYYCTLEYGAIFFIHLKYERFYGPCEHTGRVNQSEHMLQQ